MRHSFPSQKQSSLGRGTSQWGRAGSPEEVGHREQVLGLGVEAKVGTPATALPGDPGVKASGALSWQACLFGGGKGKRNTLWGSESAELS